MEPLILHIPPPNVTIAHTSHPPSLSPFSHQTLTPPFITAPSLMTSTPSELIVLSDDDGDENFAQIPECVTPAMLQQLETENISQSGCQGPGPGDRPGTVDLKLTSIVSLAGQQETENWDPENCLPVNLSSFNQEVESLTSVTTPIPGQSSVSQIQVSSVMSLSDNSTSPNRVDLIDSQHSKTSNVTTLDVDSLKSATQQTEISLSSVTNFFNGLESNPTSNLETPSTRDPSQSVNTPTTAILLPLTLASPVLNTSSGTSFTVNFTKDPQETLRENFQPTPALLLNQILSYKQLYEFEDPTTQAIKDITNCPICGAPLNQDNKYLAVLKRQANIVKHMKSVHNVVGMRCKSCKKTHVPEHNVPCLCRTCDVCLKSFPTGQGFERHAKTMHIKLDETPIEKEYDFFQCILSNSCSFSCTSIPIFAKHLAEEHHVVTHQDEDPKNFIVKCPLCSFKKTSVTKLRSHITSFHFASGSGKKFRDRKHKSLSSSIFVFSSNYDRVEDIMPLSTDNNQEDDVFVDVG